MGVWPTLYYTWKSINIQEMYFAEEVHKIYPRKCFLKRTQNLIEAHSKTLPKGQKESTLCHLDFNAKNLGC